MNHIRYLGFLCVVVISIASFSSSSFSEPSAPVVILTGFEPFENYSINPSELVAEALNGSSLEGATILGMVLPVNFTSSLAIAIDAIEHYQPVLVISLGLHARSKAIRIEKIGLNLKRYPKDDGTWSFPRRIEQKGVFFRVTSLHTYEMVRNVRAANISVQHSFFAGTYVCNSLFYQLLGYVTEHNCGTKIGFIHVPLLDTQDPQGMPLQTMIDGVKIAIQTSLK